MWRSGDSSQPPKAERVWDRAPSAGRFFNENDIILNMFGANSCFKTYSEDNFILSGN